MKRLALTVLAVSLATAGIGNVSAQRGDGRDYDRDRSAPRSDVARVTHVERLFSHYDQGRLRQECWNERVSRYESGYYRDEEGRLYREGKDGSTKGAVVGAIIGGVLGNQVGDGRGRTAATVAGAAVGAAVGSKHGDNDSDYDRYRHSEGYEVRCRTVETYADRGRGRDRERYRVSYTYAGQPYQTITHYHPGRTLRVLVDVRPQDDFVADERRR